ncbi:MAG: hypothetical protein AAF243_15205, partial [Cyanobacteria bacterium P01_A01_bin.137]
MTVKARRHRSRSNSFKVHWQGELKDYVTALAWSPAGDCLAVSSSSGEVVLWSETGLVSLLPGKSDCAIDCLSFSADGACLAAAGQQGEVYVWQILDLDRSPTVLQNPHCWIDRLVWHPTQPWLAFGAG